jgi:hypothetical protein
MTRTLGVASRGTGYGVAAPIPDFCIISLICGSRAHELHYVGATPSIVVYSIRLYLSKVVGFLAVVEFGSHCEVPAAHYL